MASKLFQPRLGSRDTEILTALDCSPLTARQIKRISTTWPAPFGSHRMTQETLQRLTAVGLVHTYRYAAIHPGQPQNYYRLARGGYQLLHGPEAIAPTKGYFSPIGLSRQAHTQALADFTVQTFLAAHASQLRVIHFAAENTLRLTLEEEVRYPDCSFTLLAGDGSLYRFFTEIDMGTERVQSTKAVESLEGKLRFYDRFQDTVDSRFRVLIIGANNSVARLDHIMQTAARVMRNPQQTLFLGSTLDNLSRAFSATVPVFVDHRDRRHAYVHPTATTVHIASAVLRQPLGV